MKTIMQEASSIIKAIEKGWNKAGKPTEFSVKIFEEPEKNFIGLTTKSAKIGIFFEEAPIKRQYKKKDIVARKRIAREIKKIEQPKKGEKKPPTKPTIKEKAPIKNRIFWTDQMVDITRQWINTTLKSMGISDNSFTAQTLNYQLKINFAKPLISESEKERQLLRSFSLLIMQSLRHKLKRPLRGFKIHLSSKA